jgi:hypothetical protein
MTVKALEPELQRVYDKSKLELQQVKDRFRDDLERMQGDHEAHVASIRREYLAIIETQ